MRAKSTRRRFPRKARPSAHEHHDKSSPGTEVLSKSNVITTPQVIRASRTRHGPRQRWGPIQYAERQILEIYPAGPPRNVNFMRLTHEVNTRLSKDAEWIATRYGKKGEVSRLTVMRAVEALLKS